MDRAYQKCLLGKTKYKRDALLFDRNATANINALIERLRSGAYQIGHYLEFYVYEPKKRLIYASSFTDKLVQTAVYYVLNEIYKKVLIYDSYACIDDKGTHKASERVQHFLRKAKWQYGPDAYIVKLDIRKYFYSIDRGVLKSLLRKHIDCAQTLQLVDKIIDTAPGEKGLPLGNITSHMLANIYLNELDQYCKRSLGIKYYVRYMDDVCMIATDKQRATELLEKATTLLNNRLRLQTNPEKTVLFPLSQGVNMVGFKTHPTHKLLRNSSKKNIKRKAGKMPDLITQGAMTGQKAEQILNSWNGHARHGNSRNFIASLLQRNPFLFYSDKFTLNTHAI